ncbi:hypothetical protein BT96DRAFT_913116, partial [Gymnopus androsaceus JB14]
MDGVAGRKRKRIYRLHPSVVPTSFSAPAPTNEKEDAFTRYDPRHLHMLLLH